MKYLIYSIFLVALLGLSAGIFGNFRIIYSTPQVMLLVVLFFGVDRNSFDAYFIALVSGLLLDVTSGLPLGGFLIAFPIIIFLCQLLFGQLLLLEFKLSYIPVIVILGCAFLFSWLYIFSHLAGALHVSYVELSGEMLARRFLPSLVYTIVLTYPLYWLVDRLQAWLKGFDIKRKLLR